MKVGGKVQLSGTCLILENVTSYVENTIECSKAFWISLHSKGSVILFDMMSDGCT